MKKRSAKIISCFICVLALGALVSVSWNAMAEGSREAFELTYSPKDISAPVGSSENRFTVLEIVPNESMAQIGYMIPGCEPVKMEELENGTSTDIASYRASMGNQGNNLAQIEEKKKFRLTDELTAEDKVSHYVIGNGAYDPGNKELMDAELLEKLFPDGAEQSEYANELYGVWNLEKNWNYSEYGYYEKVEDGTGNFQCYETTESLPENPSYTFIPVEKGTGNYCWVGVGCYYNDGTPGEYNRTENQSFYYSSQLNNNIEAYGRDCTYQPAEGGSWHYEEFDDTQEIEGRPGKDEVNTGSVENVGDKYWTTRTDRFHYVYTYNRITNNDLLIQQVFQAESADGFQSQVLVVTPTQLNNMSQQKREELIQSVEMIYIHGGQAAENLQNLWKKYNKQGRVLSEAEEGIKNFEQNDINWETAMEIVKRMASGRPAGMVMEQTAVWGQNQTENNMHKLYLMLMQYGAKSFYNQFVLNGQITSVPSTVNAKDVSTGNILTTGSYANPYQNGSKTVWGQETFRLSDAADKDYSYMHEKYLPYGGTETYQNIFVYNGDETMVQTFLSGHVKNFTADSGATVSDAFAYFQERDGEGSHEEGLNGLEFVEYILKGFAGEQKEKTHLDILEVQPCSAFIYGSKYWKLYYMSLVPWFQGTSEDFEKDVTVTTMPTWEFIGKIEDLNAKYDFIIFGANVDASNGENGYNDPNMKGLIYSSVGDLVTYPNSWVTYGMGGKYVVGDDIIRYSGNDLNERKYRELVSYLNGEQAVVIDQSLYNSWDGSVNTQKVDISSMFYQLANLINTDETAGRNIFVTGTRRENEMKQLAAYEKCGLEFYTGDGGTGYPTEYTYEEETDGNIAQGTIRYVDNGFFVYNFKIHGQENRNYKVNLYIDKNGDGLYKGSMVEQLSSADDSSEEIELMLTTQDGQEVTNGTLKADTWYVAKRKLPANYAGILPWKLEVSDVGNNNIRSSVIKYSAVKTTSSTREDIKVLQMTLTPGMTNASRYYGNGVMYMNTTGAHQNEQFKKYLDCVEDFSVSVDYLENEDWMNMFVNNFKYRTEAEKIQAWEDYLDQYDMMILGYCDMCSFTGNKIYQEGFSYFIDLGKSVMISHDMVKDATYNHIFPGTTTAYDEWLRELVGQRRYKTNQIQLKGKSILLTGNNYHYNHRNVADYTASLTGKDGVTRTVPAYGDNSTALFLKFGLKGHADRKTNSALIGSAGANQWNTGGNTYNYWLEQNYETTYVNIINQGQITNYPYKISDVIQVNKTHCQPCQLDMENDQMVVWYTLTDKYSKKYQKETQKTSGINVAESDLGTGVYSSRESDVRNGFYIYNVGNITYTGMGHTRQTYDNALTPDEMKLYVNTMISAYRAAAAKPYIEITNEDKVESGGDNLLYVPFDEGVLNVNGEKDYLDVTFKVTDESIAEISNRSYYLNFCDAGGNILSEQPAVYEKDGTAVSYTAGKGYAVEQNGNYSFRVLYTQLEAEGRMSYYLNLSSSYISSKNVEVKTSDTTRATVMEMPLFNLN